MIRECIPKYEDYAITKDGTIILLDDADWFLSMVDEEGEPFSIPNTYFEVISSFDYNSILCPCNWEELFEQNSDLGEIKKQASRWIISKPRPDILHLHTDLNDKYEMTINDTIKILSTDKKLENRSLYFDNPDIELLGSNLNKTKLLN